MRVILNPRGKWQNMGFSDSQTGNLGHHWVRTCRGLMEVWRCRLLFPLAQWKESNATSGYGSKNMYQEPQCFCSFNIILVSNTKLFIENVHLFSVISRKAGKQVELVLIQRLPEKDCSQVSLPHPKAFWAFKEPQNTRTEVSKFN